MKLLGSLPTVEGRSAGGLATNSAAVRGGFGTAAHHPDALDVTPLKYRRRPLTEAEMQAVLYGGA